LIFRAFDEEISLFSDYVLLRRALKVIWTADNKTPGYEKIKTDRYLLLPPDYFCATVDGAGTE
jgi:hypothetical protein